jgi:hypothetical protein
MSSSAAIDVALGLVFTYFVFSSFCSGVNEVIAKVFNSRGTALFSSVNALLEDAGLVKAFWMHPLIAGSIKTRAKAGDVAAATDVMAGMDFKSPPASTSTVTKVLPSYLSAQTFANVVIDLTSFGQVAAAGVGAFQDTAGPSAVAGWGTAAPAPAPLAPTGVKVPDSITSLVRLTEGDQQRLQAEIEAWFNGTMDRLSGWYKRRTQLILFVLSVITAVAFNVNTIHIGEELWRQPAERATVAQQAQTATGSTSVKAALDEATSFPIGWSAADRASSAGQWALLIVGWLMTIGALTLGAPFWFDLLTRLNSLRSTGPPPKT